MKLGILVRNKKEANFIWKKLLSFGYNWNYSFSKDFRYIFIIIKHCLILTIIIINTFIQSMILNILIF